jgi:hypothetical protein
VTRKHCLHHPLRLKARLTYSFPLTDYSLPFKTRSGSVYTKVAHLQGLGFHRIPDTASRARHPGWRSLEGYRRLHELLSEVSRLFCEDSVALPLKLLCLAEFQQCSETSWTCDRPNHVILEIPRVDSVCGHAFSYATPNRLLWSVLTSFCDIMTLIIQSIDFLDKHIRFFTSFYGTVTLKIQSTKILDKRIRF